MIISDFFYGELSRPEVQKIMNKKIQQLKCMIDQLNPSQRIKNTKSRKMQLYIAYMYKDNRATSLNMSFTFWIHHI